jgi:hypothetical protein
MSTWAYSRRDRNRETLWLLVLTTVLAPLLPAQDNSQQEHATVIHGRVLNQLTKEPIARALVTAAGDEYAALTDDHGQFEIKIVEQAPVSGNVMTNFRVLTSEGLSAGMGNRHSFQARKPGFLPPGPTSGLTRILSGNSSDLTIYLVPEALIIGHVEVPGTEGEVHIACELYRRTMTEGREDWQPAGTFTSWSDGEFRFSKLAAGSYKVITHEEMDRDARVGAPGALLFGYPPVYYPNTTDFSTAAPVTVRAGETAQINLTVARRQYFPVHISVGNAPAGRPMNLSVYPMGHRSPGWSLGYNPMDQAIEGMLPNGSYTLEADAVGESSGIANLVVNGRPASATLQLIPNTSITVNIHQEFKAAQANPGTALGAIVITGSGDREPVQAHVSLMPLEPLRRLGHALARPVPGSQGRIMTFPSVRPGSYRVQVLAEGGYGAAIESGGIDLLRQPLVVGFGGGNAPIEITLRDDGAQVPGTVQDETDSAQTQANPSFRYIFLLPAEASAGQMQQIAIPNNNFVFTQVPPGDYLAIAFDQMMQDLPYGNEEALRPLVSKGRMIHVEAGGKVPVDNLKVVSAGEAE